MAKLKDLIKEHATLGGVVSRPAFDNLDMGYKSKSSKLSNIVEDVYGEQIRFWLRLFGGVALQE